MISPALQSNLQAIQDSFFPGPGHVFAFRPFHGRFATLCCALLLGSWFSHRSLAAVPLETEIPPEVIEGTPMPIDLPNLVPAPKQAPQLLVPEGTTLLSGGRTVTSSDDFPIIGELNLITDGEKEGGEGYYVELGPKLQWVQIDLEKTASIAAVWVWHYHSQLRAYHDVLIQVSDDPDFKTGVQTIFNNDFDNSAGMGAGKDKPYVETRFGLLVDAKGAKGRYVRLWSSGNTSGDSNHYIEVEVFGTFVQ